MTPSPSPILSVIIPTFNYVALVRAAIDSVTRQMDLRSELIVMDDGSTDGTPAALAELKLPDHLACNILRQDNAGPSAARNNAFRHSRGSYVFFLDADDELLPGALEAIHEVIVQYPDIGLILGGHIDCFSDGTEKLRAPSCVTGTPLERLRAYLLEKKISVSHGSTVFRRDIIEQRLYPEHLRQAEDIPVFAYAIVTARTHTLHCPLARIRKHATSLRHNATLAKQSCLPVVDETFKQLADTFQTLRPAYTAQRALSVFRTCYLAGETEEAAHFYSMALSYHWRQAIRWSYFGKYLRLLIVRAVRKIAWPTTDLRK